MTKDSFSDTAALRALLPETSGTRLLAGSGSLPSASWRWMSRNSVALARANAMPSG